jgi:hypothetical protein
MSDDVYSPDVLTRIVNVHWGGLAVEFGDKAQDAPKPPPTALRLTRRPGKRA